MMATMKVMTTAQTAQGSRDRFSAADRDGGSSSSDVGAGADAGGPVMLGIAPGAGCASGLAGCATAKRPNHHCGLARNTGAILIEPPEPRNASMTHRARSPAR